MKKTREMITANLPLVDAVIEVCDARIPVSSRNPLLGEIISAKTRILLLNKKDLADDEATAAWLAHFRAHGLKELRTAIATDGMSGDGVKNVLAALTRMAEARTGNRADKPMRVMICGVPNSGKSSLINRFTGRRATQVGDRPGVTKGKQWLTMTNGMQLMDTPGLLWPKFEDPKQGLDLAFCGAIKDEILDTSELALELLKILTRDYPKELETRYALTLPPATSLPQLVIAASEPQSLTDTRSEIAGQARNDKSSADPLETMEAIAQKRGLLLPGKRIDYERTGRMILDEFRAGKIGKITLEHPGD
jgi:ribosome biogenesis GTPase A